MISPRPALRLPLLALVLVLVAAVTTACGGTHTVTPKAVKKQCTYTADDSQPDLVKKATLPPGNPPKDEPATVTIATNRGDIKVTLDATQAPCTVNSFVSLAKQGFFDNSHCHRLVDQGLYVLQCGNPLATGKPNDAKAGGGGPGYSFKDELVTNDPRLQPCQTDASSGQDVCTYTTGTVAMANSGPDTNGSQFFLVYKDSPLPNSYTVFGKMSAAGVKVVQSVAAAGAYPADQYSNTPPKQEVVITSVK